MGYLWQNFNFKMWLFPKVIKKNGGDARTRQTKAKKQLEEASFWKRVELGDLGLESESVSLQDSDVIKSLKLYEPLFFNHQMGTKSNTCDFMEFLWGYHKKYEGTLYCKTLLH